MAQVDVVAADIAVMAQVVAGDQAPAAHQQVAGQPAIRFVWSLPFLAAIAACLVVQSYSDWRQFALWAAGAPGAVSLLDWTVCCAAGKPALQALAATIMVVCTLVAGLIWSCSPEFTALGGMAVPHAASPVIPDYEFGFMAKVVLASEVYENVRTRGVLSGALLPAGWGWACEQLMRIAVLAFVVGLAGFKLGVHVVEFLGSVDARVMGDGQPVEAAAS
ncbi:hypothetical protein ABPG75_004738 [Micractinium tetrahymenae]